VDKKKFFIALGIAALLVPAVFLAIGLLRNFSASKGGLITLGEASKLLAQAKDLQAKGELFAAKTAYQKMLNEYPASPGAAKWQKEIESLNIGLLFSPALTPKSTLYEIKPGDTLTKIAKKFNTTVELIQKSNGISDDKIMPGRKIKIWTQPFSIVVDKSQNILILKSGEEVIKTYSVSTGANNSTPTGVFKVDSKLYHPTWFKPGEVVPPESSENILGSRWIGINLPGYGIHGTTEPESLGKQVTQGCVRMSNADVEELYTIVPKGTEVLILN